MENELAERSAGHIDRTNLAVLLLIFEEYEDAAGIAIESLSRDPNDVRALIVLAKISQKDQLAKPLASAGCSARKILVEGFEAVATKYNILRMREQVKLLGTEESKMERSNG